MKLTILIVLVGAAMVAAQSCTDKVQNQGELGVDCGWDGDGDDNECDPCTCYTDLTRPIEPPTLINENVNYTNRVSGDVNVVDETGIDDTDLRIVLTVDPITELTVGDGNARHGGASMYGTDDYIAPAIVWITTPHTAPTPANPVTGACPTPTIAAVTTTESDEAIKYGIAGAGCASHQTTLTALYPIATVIEECGWTSEVNQANRASIGGTFTGTYTIFRGTFELHTSYYGGLLAGAAEVAFRREDAFRIEIQIQEQVSVQSGDIQVIGAATNQSAITHQIWNTATSVVDINALIGVSYPAGPSIFGPLVTTGADPNALIQLQDSFCAGRSARPVDVDIDTCIDAAYRGLEHVGASIAADTPQYCDVDGVTGCSIGDFFSAISVTQGSQTSDFAGTQTLPDTSATPTGGSTAGLCPNNDGISADSDACLSNIHIRLDPRTGWCDLNFDLQLIVGIVCRNDLDGTSTPATVEADTDNNDHVGNSLIPDGLYDTTTASNGDFFDSSFTCATSTLPSSKAFGAPDFGGGGITFSIASDYFCARTVYTASLIAEAAVYADDDWGADCTASGATTCAATTDMNQCVNDVDPAGTNDVAGFGVCRAMPGLYADVPAAPTVGVGETSRKSQNSFVFGQTMYFETRVVAEAGVNLLSSTITELWTASNTLASNYRAADEAQNPGSIPTAVVVNDGTGPSADPTADTWAQRLVTAGVIQTSLFGYQSGTTGNPGVAVSDNINTDDLSARTITYANQSPQGTFGARLGDAFEGVSRATIPVNDITIYTVNLQTAATPAIIWAKVNVAYKDEDDQETLRAGEVTTQGVIPAGMGNRARLAAAALPPLAGQPNTGAQVGIRTGSTAGSNGGGSTIAGFSSTTVLAAAVVLGAVVAVAAAGFFVARKRSQPTAKTTSSSLELNDAAMTQA